MTLQLALGAAPGRLSPARLARRGGHAAIGVRSGPPCPEGAPAERAELSTLPPEVPGLGTVACAIPTRSRALLVIAAVLEGEPAPAAFPCCFPALWRGTEPLLLFLSPWRQPGLKSLCRGGEEIREYNSSSLGNKSHVYIGQLLACWHKRPWRSVTPGSSRFNRPAPLRLPGGDSRQTPEESGFTQWVGPQNAVLLPACQVLEMPGWPESRSHSDPSAAGGGVPAPPQNASRQAAHLSSHAGAVAEPPARPLSLEGAAGRERWQLPQP